MTDKQKEFLSLCDTAFSSGSARMLVFSNSTEHGIKKLRILPRSINGKTVFVTERTLTDGRVTQKTAPFSRHATPKKRFLVFCRLIYVSLKAARFINETKKAARL